MQPQRRTASTAPCPRSASFPDRAEKIQKRKGQRLTVVKSALRKYLRGDDSLVTRIVEAVEERVVVASRRTVNMSLYSISKRYMGE
jgi:hypothetical protein